MSDAHVVHNVAGQHDVSGVFPLSDCVDSDSFSDVGWSVVYTHIQGTRSEVKSMLLSISEAAKAAGVARSTIYEKIKEGELTRSADKKIDTADLLRVFGELKNDSAKSESEVGSPQAVAQSLWLQELADRQQDQIERLQATIERQAAELRTVEERAGQREQAWLQQIDKMTTALLPAPESEPKRGVLAKLFG